jgi:hypothetical protein
MNATVIMVSQGAIALGGIVWGYSSQAAGVNVTLPFAAVAMALSLLLAIPGDDQQSLALARRRRCS